MLLLLSCMSEISGLNNIKIKTNPMYKRKHKNVNDGRKGRSEEEPDKWDKEYYFFPELKQFMSQTNYN